MKQKHSRVLKRFVAQLPLLLLLVGVFALNVQLLKAQRVKGLQVIDLPDSNYTRPFGISDNGDVVGYYSSIGSEKGFLFRDGEFFTIEFPGADHTRVLRITSAGEITGAYFPFPSNSIRYGFLLDEEDFLPLNFPGENRSAANGINSRGEIVGPNRIEGGGYQGYLWRDGEVSFFEVPDAFVTDPVGINARGEIVGSCRETQTAPLQGFLLSRGEFSTFSIPGAVWTQASDINDRGQIVGSYGDYDGDGNRRYHGFVFWKGEFTTLDVEEALDTRLYGVNNRGDLVGIIRLPYDLRFHGFILPKGALVKNLAE